MPINQRVPEEDRGFGGELFCGDCRDQLKMLEDNFAEGCITDPPYGIRLLGNTWDQGLPPVDVWEEVYRVLVPGAHLVAATSRERYHHLATQLEEIGFEIRDMFIWNYTQSSPGPSQLIEGEWRSEAKRNHEPWVVARKPLEGSLKENWAKWKVGGVLVGERGVPGWNSNVAKVAKANKAERNLGMAGAPVKLTAGAQAKHKRKGGAYNAGMNQNNHPTLKSLGITRRILRQYVPEGLTVLDPFMGSGTTGMACLADGYSFFGAEMNEEFYEIASARIWHAHQNPESIPLAE
jgi:DNA modification methylase